MVHITEVSERIQGYKNS